MGGVRRTTQEMEQATQRPSSLDYKAFYRAKVTKQNSDGTIDLAPVDTRFQTFQNVPCMFGIPGVRIQVEAGSFVFFTFWNGAPGQVYVSSWDPSNAVVEMSFNGTTIKLNPDSGSYAGSPIARIADSIDCGSFTFGAGTGGATMVYFPPGQGQGLTPIKGKLDGGNTSVLG